MAKNVPTGSMSVNDDRVESTALWYSNQLPDWMRSDCLMGGTKAMRAAGTTYLPKFEHESQPDYDLRLSVSTLTPFYATHYHTAMGLMFAEKVTIEDSTIPQEELDNIDNLGHNLEAFTEMCAAQIMLKGLHHVQVDMPPNPGALTLEDDQRLNLRPYWVHVPVEALTNAFYETKNNMRSLTQTRVAGVKSVRAGRFGNSQVKTIRVMDKNEDGSVTFEVWIREGSDSAPYKLSADEKDMGVLGINEIPLATGQMDEKVFMVSRSILDDISFKNIEHWQSASDQRSILTVARYPIQYQLGTDAAQNCQGSGAVFHSPGRTSKDAQDVSIGFAEISGESIVAGERDLEAIVKQANVLSLNNAQSGNRTATGDVLDVTISSSPLQMVASATENLVNRCLALHAKWKGAGIKPGKVKISKDFGLTASEASRITALMTMRAQGDIDHETFIDELKEIRVLRTSKTAEQIRAKLEREGTGLFDEPDNSQTDTPANDDNQGAV